MLWDARIALPFSPRFTQVGVAPTITKNNSSFIFLCKTLNDKMQTHIIEHSFNTTIDQVLCFLFLFFFLCSILLNAYGTPTKHVERATFDQADSIIGSGVLVM